MKPSNNQLELYCEENSVCLVWKRLKSPAPLIFSRENIIICLFMQVSNCRVRYQNATSFGHPRF